MTKPSQYTRNENETSQWRSEHKEGNKMQSTSPLHCLKRRVVKTAVSSENQCWNIMDLWRTKQDTHWLTSSGDTMEYKYNWRGKFDHRAASNACFYMSYCTDGLCIFKTWHSLIRNIDVNGNDRISLSGCRYWWPLMSVICFLSKSDMPLSDFTFNLVHLPSCTVAFVTPACSWLHGWHNKGNFPIG